MNTTTPVEIAHETWTNENWLIPYLFVLLILGTIGNTFGVFVFLNRSMRKYSCSLYFLLMSIFDEITLFFWITNRISGELTYDQFRNRSTILCKLFVIMTYSSGQASIGMLVLATFDRLYTTFKIAHGHFDVRLLARRRRFQHICLCIFFLIMFGFAVPLFGSQLISPPDSNEQFCVIVDEHTSRIYSIIDLCVYAIIPCICMLVGDTLILYYIGKARARVISTHNVSKRRERQLSITLVIASIISLILVSPYSFLNVLINFSNILDNDCCTLYTLNDIFGLLSTFTHAMRFYLFLIISNTIRQHFKIVLKSFILTCLNTRNVIRPAIILAIKTTTPSQPPANIV
jgi:hypothetical protein